MGLDIAFNRKQAVDAGLAVRSFVRGTPEKIALARKENDFGYARWLAKEVEVVDVPSETDPHSVENDGGTSGDIVVRANRWGSTYAPLTRWLEANGISWSEF